MMNKNTRLAGGLPPPPARLLLNPTGKKDVINPGCHSGRRRVKTPFPLRCHFSLTQQAIRFDS